jgi:hypothetical protein
MWDDAMPGSDDWPALWSRFLRAPESDWTELSRISGIALIHEPVEKLCRLRWNAEVGPLPSSGWSADRREFGKQWVLKEHPAGELGLNDALHQQPVGVML